MMSERAMNALMTALKHLSQGLLLRKMPAFKTQLLKLVISDYFQGILPIYRLNHNDPARAEHNNNNRPRNGLRNLAFSKRHSFLKSDNVRKRHFDLFFVRNLVRGDLRFEPVTVDYSHAKV